MDTGQEDEQDEAIQIIDEERELSSESESDSLCEDSSLETSKTCSHVSQKSIAESNGQTQPVYEKVHHGHHRGHRGARQAAASLGLKPIALKKDVKKKQMDLSDYIQKFEQVEK